MTGVHPSDHTAHRDHDYEQAACGLRATGVDGTIRTVNATLLEWLGQDREELVGQRRFVDLLTVGDRIYHETHYAPLLRMQSSVTGVAATLRTVTGKRLPVLLASRTWPDPVDGQPVIHTAVFDAADRRGYERELLRGRDNADHERDRAQRLSRVLQRSLLPPRLPVVPGIATAALYHPASTDEVGGDFYDLFNLPGDRWGFFLGDVCGKGPEAAALTSLTRYTLRSAATQEPDPATLLQTLNSVLRQEDQHANDAQCTVVLGTLTPHDRRVTVELASAGHPLPLLLSADGDARYLDLFGGQLLGALAHPTIASTTIDLEPGDTLLLYSDGLTEARIDSRRTRYSEEQLLAFALDVAPANPGDAVEAVRKLLASFGDGVDDDAAVLALGILAAP